MRLINYIKNISPIIPFSMGFLAALSAYSIYPLLWDKAHYHLIALSFVFYVFSGYVSMVGNKSIFAFMVLMAALNSLIDEMFFNPCDIELNEYIGFAIIIIITIRFKNTWKR